MTSRYRLTILCTIFAIFSLFFSLIKGSSSFSLFQPTLNEQFNFIFLKIRLPRTISAFTAGGLLSLAGLMMQLLLQNPLADPYVLGISSSAAFFTLLMMLFGLSETWLVGGAWLGSLIAIILILALSRKHGWQTHSLLLIGIALACGFSACISFLLLLSPDQTIHSMLFWLMGDLNAVSIPWLSLLVLCLGFFICMALAPGLNVLSLGELEAKTLGLPTKKYVILLYLLSSLFTACAIAIVGCIGFIGLIIPHITRQIAGVDHRLTVPLSLLLGGSFLTLTDTIARTLILPQQLPVGIVMTFIGIPIFIWLLQK